MALREVNLVPPEFLLRRQVLRHLFLWASCLVLALLVIIGGNLLHTHLVLAKNRSLISLNEVDTNLDSRIVQIKRLQGELDNLHERQAVLESITTNEPYSLVLLRLADIMNENTWLSQLSIDESRETEGTTQVELTGYSFSNEDLGDFLSRLTGTLVFRDVVLKYANEIEDPRPEEREKAGRKVINFQLLCSLSGE